jgi:hypothetical protein
VGTYIVGDAARTTYNGLGAGATQDQFDAAYNTWDQMANLNHIFYIGEAVVYSFTLVDAIYSAKRKPISKAEFQEKPPALQFGMLDAHTPALKYRLLEF